MGILLIAFEVGILLIVFEVGILLIVVEVKVVGVFINVEFLFLVVRVWIGYGFENEVSVLNLDLKELEFPKILCWNEFLKLDITPCGWFGKLLFVGRFDCGYL